MLKSSLLASVIIPTFNRDVLLQRCLESVLQQCISPEHYEVIVADDRPSSSTKNLIFRLQRTTQVSLKYVPVTGVHGPAAARNTAVRSSIGRILAFTDDDTVPDVNWLARGLASFGERTIALVGTVHVPISDLPTDYEHNESQLARAGFVTANCFVARHAFAALQGFDTDFQMAWREDSDLYFRLLAYARQNNYNILRTEALVIHPIRTPAWGVSLKQQRKSMYNALLYRKHPDLYRLMIQAAPPYRYYLISLTATLGLMIVAFYPPLAVACLGIWTLATLSFCRKRLKKRSHRVSHVFEMIVTSALIPPLSVYWRLRGALKFKVFFA